jgi:hypothetical protein
VSLLPKHDDISVLRDHALKKMGHGYTRMNTDRKNGFLSQKCNGG